MNRRAFLLSSGGAALVAAALLLSGCVTEAPRVTVANNLSIVVDSSDAIVVAAPVQRAVDQLRRTVMTRGFVVLMCSRMSEAGSGDLCVVVTGASSQLVRDLGAAVPETPGSLAIVPGHLSGREVLLASGRDEAGLVQALTEISEAVTRSANPAATLRPAHAREPNVVFGTPVVAPAAK
jgi:hypothetical protein